MFNDIQMMINRVTYGRQTLLIRTLKRLLLK